MEGAQKVDIDAGGDLVLPIAGGQVKLHKPVVYQEKAGRRKEIAGSYMLRGPGQVGFQIAAYDRSQPLVIDPVLVYSTYLGGNNWDRGSGIATDAGGNVYVTGETSSPDFPTASPLQATCIPYPNYPDFCVTYYAFVTKLTPDGQALVYSTYLGSNNNGSSAIRGYDIAVDAAGNAYVTGSAFTSTSSLSDFPTVNALQPACNGGYHDAFVTKLTPDGSALVYSTCLGGYDSDQGYDIAADAAGSAYVTGYTRSLNFPTAHPLQPTCMPNVRYRYCQDAFVAKITPDGSALVYSTFLGGSEDEQGFGIAADAAGSAYVTGVTQSLNFPMANPFQASFDSFSTAFVTKLTPDGSAFVYSTYLGGGDSSAGAGIATDPAGNAYMTGSTVASNFPMANPFQATHGGGYFDAFVAKLTADGSTLVYSTYLGGSDQDFGSRIVTDSAGNAYVMGQTYSTNFPTENAFQATCLTPYGYCLDAFVTKLTPDGSALAYSTYLGLEAATSSIAVDTSGNVYLTGFTDSPNLRTVNPLQATYGGGSFDAFVAKLEEVPVLNVAIDIKPGSFPNSINPGSRGKIPVAVLSSTDFSASAQTNRNSLTFGRTGDEHSLAFCDSSPEDVNKDGFLDLVCHFDTQTAAFQSGDTQGILKGQALSGTPLSGTDSVSIVPAKK